MEPRSIKHIARNCGGEWVGRGSAEIPVTRVCTDSRQAQTGDLFVALTGERFDGHAFLEEARQRGATAFLVDRCKRSTTLNGCAVIQVDDPRRALGRLAAAYRQEFQLPIIAVGGSNGKTTTKELMAAVLRQKMSVLSSEASFNNDIGVPLTLLNLRRTHQAAVLEVGTNHPGELAPLVRMIQPRYGVMTSLGREHLEFFGDLIGVAEEEGWLAQLLPPTGRFFVNRDSCGQEMGSVVRRSAAPVVQVGHSPEMTWRATRPQLDEAGTTFWVSAPDPDFAGQYRIRLLGRHQVVNALLAIAVGAELGLNPAEIRTGLASCAPLKMRLEPWSIRGIRVLDDCYNANADSMAAALQTLHDVPCAGRRIAVLGDMAELGPHSEAAHAEAGLRAAELKIDALFAVGKMARIIGDAARAAGLSQVRECDCVEAAADQVREFLQSGDVVLLKASRATRLERIGARLREN